MKEAKEQIKKILESAEEFMHYVPNCQKISMTVTPEFFDACALALEALDDIDLISTAVYKAETKNDSYCRKLAFEKAEKWYSKEHVTRKSIIKTQLEEIMNHFTDPVSYDELVKIIQEMKGDT